MQSAQRTFKYMPSKRTLETTRESGNLGGVLKRQLRGRRSCGIDEPAIKVEMEEVVKRVKMEEKKKENVKLEGKVKLEDKETLEEEKKENQEVVGKKEDMNTSVRAELSSDMQNVKIENIEAELAALLANTHEFPENSLLKLDSNPPHFFPSVSSEDVLPSQPKNWENIYNSIVEMRKVIVTPVDTMGCERMPDTITPDLSRNNPKLYRFQLLISLMLSSQTKDEVNYSAMVSLNTHFKQKGFPSLCLQACLDAAEAELDECIKKVGFHRRKATFIKKTCRMIKDKFDGDIPKTIEEIVTFPGVGPKMGHLLLQNGWGINLGIGVDVHLHRLAQMWRWVPKSDKPESTREALEEWLPRKYWADVNPLLVGFGQTVCVPRAPNCDVCTLATNGLCKGVNRKLAKAEITEARLEKLGKQRGNLLKLVELRNSE